MEFLKQLKKIVSTLQVQLNKIDWTPIEHGIIAIIIQALVVWFNGDVWIGGLAGSLVFVGREHAQAEQRCIQKFYENHRANAPWHCGFQGRSWDASSICDVFVPILCCLCFAIIAKCI
jgi:hypothetical protein